MLGRHSLLLPGSFWAEQLAFQVTCILAGPDSPLKPSHSSCTHAPSTTLLWENWDQLRCKRKREGRAKARCKGQGGSPSIFGAPNSEHGFDLVLSSQVPLCTALPYMVLPQPVQTHIYTF